MTPDSLGYRDSSNLYAFAGGDPVNGRDPSGESCQGSGFWNTVANCAQDIAWVGEAFGEETFSPTKTIANVKHSVGGLLKTLVTDAAAVERFTHKDWNPRGEQSLDAFIDNVGSTVTQAVFESSRRRRRTSSERRADRVAELNAGALRIDRFLNADKDHQQEILGGGTAKALEVVALTRAFGPSSAAVDESAGAAISSSQRVTYATGREWYDYLVAQHGVDNVEWVAGAGRTIDSWPSQLPRPTQTGRMFRIAPPPRSSSFVRELTTAAGPRPLNSVAHHVQFLMLQGPDDGAINGAWIGTAAHSEGHAVLKWVERLPLGSEVVIRP